MGYPCDEVEDFSIWTNKSVWNLPGNILWVISGEGKPRRYYLCGVFIVDDVGEEEDLTAGFKFYARGVQGTFFRPQIQIDKYPWFKEFLASQQNFSLGLREVKEGKYIKEFEKLGEQNK